MKKKLIVTTAFLLVALGLSVILVGQKQEIRKKAAGNGVILGMSPSTVSAAPNDIITMGITVNTGDKTISGAELHLTYDASKLEAQSITAGNFLPVVLTQGQISGGNISITLGSQPTDPKKGSGILASITFKALVPSTSRIDFASSTQVTAIGETNNVLQSADGAQVTINTPPSTTVAPSATSIPATSTPAPSVTPVPSLTPTSTPTPTSAPTPTLPSPPSPTPTPFHYVCVGQACTAVTGAGVDTCVSNLGCRSSSPTPTQTATPPSPTITPVASCPKKSQGDANCDGVVDGIDYSIWLSTQCRPSVSQKCADNQADFNKDGNIDDNDYKIWFAGRSN